jgi:hypothetical protein
MGDQTVVLDGRTLRSGRPGDPRRHWKDQSAPGITGLTFDAEPVDGLAGALRLDGAFDEGAMHSIAAELRVVINRDTAGTDWDEQRAAKLRSGIRRALIRHSYPAAHVEAALDQVISHAETVSGRDFGNPPVVDWTFDEEPAPLSSDYRMAHRAPTDDGYSLPVSELFTAFNDAHMLEHPQWSSADVDQETLAQVRAALSDPAATLTIYRSAPASVTGIQDGDWVSLSRAYAELHGAEDGWPVMAERVSAAQVFTDGNDLNEFGFVAVPRAR